MAFMQRYTQAREAIARIEEMQSQARYREAQIQVQAAEMARKAQEDARKAKLANDLANYTPQPAVAGDMPAPPMGLLRQNPQAMQEIAALQQTIKRNNGLAEIYKKNGSDKWIEIEEKNAEARKHLTGIYDKFEKQQQDDRKEIAQAGLALANAPGQAMFNATWVGLSPETQAYYRQKGLPIDKDGMPIIANGVQQALKSIAMTNLTASEQGAIQTEARQAANMAADNERADEAAKRDAIRTKLQQAAGARDAIAFSERNKPSPAQEGANRRQALELADKTFARVERNYKSAVDKTEFSEVKQTKALFDTLMTPLIRRDAKGNETFELRKLSAPDQATIQQSVIRLWANYKSRAGATNISREAFEQMTSTLGDAAKMVQTIGQGKAVFDVPTALALRKTVDTVYAIKNDQVVEEGLRAMKRLDSQIPDEHKDSYGAGEFKNIVGGDMDAYLERAAKIPGRVAKVNGKIIVKGSDGHLYEVPE